MEVTFDFHGRVREFRWCAERNCVQARFLKGENTCLISAEIKQGEKRHIFQFSCQMLIRSTQTQGLAYLQVYLYIIFLSEFNGIIWKFPLRAARLFKKVLFLSIYFSKLTAQLIPWDFLLLFSPYPHVLICFFPLLLFHFCRKRRRTKRNKWWGGSGSGRRWGGRRGRRESGNKKRRARGGSAAICAG